MTIPVIVDPVFPQGVDLPDLAKLICDEFFAGRPVKVVCENCNLPPAIQSDLTVKYQGNRYSLQTIINYYLRSMNCVAGEYKAERNEQFEEGKPYSQFLYFYPNIEEIVPPMVRLLGKPEY